VGRALSRVHSGWLIQSSRATYAGVVCVVVGVVLAFLALR